MYGTIVAVLWTNIVVCYSTVWCIYVISYHTVIMIAEVRADKQVRLPYSRHTCVFVKMEIIMFLDENIQISELRKKLARLKV